MDRDATRVAEQLGRVHALLTASDPLPQDHLVAVTRDRYFAQGSTIPTVYSEFSSTPSGLVVPTSVARLPEPIDQVKVYLDAEQVLGVSISRDEVIDNLAQVSLELAIPWIAGWLARLHAPGAIQGAVDALYVDQEIGARVAPKVHNLLRDPKTVLLTPQGLTCLLKLALLICPQKGPPEVHESHGGHLPLALLGLMEHLAAGLAEAADEQWVIERIPGPLGRETMANQMGNSHRQEAGRWAAFIRCWKELPVELKDHPRVENLEQTYRDATGVPLDDLVAICAALWATTVNATPHVGPDHFNGLEWSVRRLRTALDLIASTPEDLGRAVYADMETHGFAWSRRALEHHPVIRWPSGHLTVVDPELLVGRATGGWPLLDIQREFEARGQSRKAAQASSSYQHVMEAYAIEIARSMTAGGREGRVYDDSDLMRAFGRSGQVADMAIDYGHAWVVVEATTRGVQSRTIAGVSDEAATQDIERFVRKCRQIDATVAHLRNNEEALVNYSASAGVRRFHPVLLVASPISIDPVFMTLLRTALAEEGVLQGSDVAPLEVMELEDLDVVEALIEEGGPSLLTVLSEKEYSPLHRVAVRDYVLLGLRRRGLLRPSRVDRRWRGWLETAARMWAPAA